MAARAHERRIGAQNESHTQNLLKRLLSRQALEKPTHTAKRRSPFRSRSHSAGAPKALLLDSPHRHRSDSSPSCHQSATTTRDTSPQNNLACAKTQPHAAARWGEPVRMNWPQLELVTARTPQGAAASSTSADYKATNQRRMSTVAKHPWPLTSPSKQPLSTLDHRCSNASRFAKALLALRNSEKLRQHGIIPQN